MVRILVCDDSEYIRSMIRKIVEEIGHEVVGEATNGQEVVDMFSRLRPDVVTVDVIMPVKHGIDALTEIMKMDPEARVVIVSSVTHEPLIKKGIERGALNFITKPFTPSEFINGFSVAT